MLGQLGHFSGKMNSDKAWDTTANEAARPVPGRENGGNCDIKNLSRGCTVGPASPKSRIISRHCVNALP